MTIVSRLRVSEGVRCDDCVTRQEGAVERLVRLWGRERNWGFDMHTAAKRKALSGHTSVIVALVSTRWGPQRAYISILKRFTDPTYAPKSLYIVLSNRHLSKHERATEPSCCVTQSSHRTSSETRRRDTVITIRQPSTRWNIPRLR